MNYECERREGIDKYRWKMRGIQSSREAEVGLKGEVQRQMQTPSRKGKQKKGTEWK